MRYNCNLCELSDAGVSTGTGGGQGTGGSRGTGGAGIPPNCCSVVGGCAVGGAGRDGLGVLGLLAAVGLTAFLRRRARATRHAAD